MSKTLLFSPNWNWDKSRLPVDTLLPPISLPLEYAYMASSLTGDVLILDAYASGYDEHTVITIISEFQPDHAVISTAPSILYWRCPPMSIDAPRIAIELVKRYCNATTIAIGPHPTFTPAWFSARTLTDHCFRGAVEIQLPYIINNDLLSRSEFVWSDERRSRIAVENAADIPPATFDGFDFSQLYAPHMWCISDEERAAAGDLTVGAVIEASRGCPWACSYCAKGPIRDVFHRRPIAAVSEELDMLSRLGVEYVFFIDETFNIRGPAFDELLDILETYDMKFGFQGRPDLVNESTARRLQRAGCVYCELGIDVLSDNLSLNIGRRQRSKATAEGLRLMKESIPIVRFNRINLSTIDYRNKLGLRATDDWPYPADPAYPYPGAPLGTELMRLYGKEEFDWEFAERYSWWLRIEVSLQRRLPETPDHVLQDLKNHFLNLTDDSAAIVAAQFEINQAAPEFHEQNKHVNW